MKDGRPDGNVKDGRPEGKVKEKEGAPLGGGPCLLTACSVGLGMGVKLPLGGAGPLGAGSENEGSPGNETEG